MLTRGISLFDFFRFILCVGVTTYTGLHIVSGLWRWHVSTAQADRYETLLRQYLVTLVLRTSAHRFWAEFVQIVVLAGVFVFLIWLHR